MRVMDEGIEEIFVTRDPKRSSVEVRIGEATGGAPCLIRLNGEEARKLAALILFHAARLSRAPVGWGMARTGFERKSA